MKKQEYSRKSKFKSKKLAPANYLIVCEGMQTEPNYFKGLRKKINDKYVNYANKRYGQVWVVFDKDDYSDEQFDKAIKTCDYNVAWSNPNFELWLLAHLKRVDRYISKDKILTELNKEFQKNGFGEYRKNDDKIFDKATSNGKINTAITNCEYMESLNKDGQESQRNPMTTVYKIVEGLKEYLE